MGRRNYYCEFCERSFADILSVRKKHINSIQHKRNRKLHYDSFKDAATLLAEASQKNHCKRFFQSGYCDFGELCKYSHVDTSKQTTQVTSSSKPSEIDMEKVHDWLAKWKKKHEKDGADAVEYRLPASFPPPHLLPPSLQPPLPGFEGKNTNDWG